MPARPKHTQADVLAAIRRRKGKLYLAAADLKVTAQTLRNYGKRWPEVADAVREARGLMLDTAESKLYAAVEKGQAWAVCFFLKTQGKRRGYVERTEQRLGGDKNAPPLKTETNSVFTLEALESLSLEAKREVLQAIRRQKAGGEAPGPGAKPPFPAPAGVS